jgi:hypothetical protein
MGAIQMHGLTANHTELLRDIFLPFYLIYILKR